MRVIGRLLVVLLLTGASFEAQKQDGNKLEWAPVPGRILTRWAAQVTPERVHPEYPKPRMWRSRSTVC